MFARDPFWIKQISVAAGDAQRLMNMHNITKCLRCIDIELDRILCGPTGRYNKKNSEFREPRHYGKLIDLHCFECLQNHSRVSVQQSVRR